MSMLAFERPLPEVSDVYRLPFRYYSTRAPVFLQIVSPDANICLPGKLHTPNVKVSQLMMEIHRESGLLHYRSPSMLHCTIHN